MVPGTHHSRSRLIKHLCGVLLAGLLLHGPAAAEDARAEDVVERLNAALHQSLRSARDLGYEGRYGLLEPVLRQSFDFPFMARIAVGRDWADLGASEREQVVDL